MEDWERDDLIANLVAGLQPCNRDIQDRMIAHLTQCDADYGRRVAEGLGLPVLHPQETPAEAR
jgi:catalase